MSQSDTPDSPSDKGATVHSLQSRRSSPDRSLERRAFTTDEILESMQLSLEQLANAFEDLESRHVALQGHLMQLLRCLKKAGLGDLLPPPQS